MLVLISGVKMYLTCLFVVDKSILFWFQKLQVCLITKRLSLNDLIGQKFFVWFNVYFNVL